MSIEVIKKELPGVIVIVPKYFEDERGFFFEAYNQLEFAKLKLNYRFVQDNQSYSKKNVIRGLHFQRRPYEQTKLVRCVRGEILDVAVDIRKDSPTFGKWTSEILSSTNGHQMIIPRGFAHGFSVLSDYAEVLYKCDNYYNKESEGGIIFNDDQLNIDWKIIKKDQIVSKKDLMLPKWKNI